ncbi:MAG: response regulator [Phycisphaerae bacterium]|nr:response regulator [Phycisphaerae bacterium]
MVCANSQMGEVNVLASQTNWAWPRAVQDIFQPAGVNCITVQRADEFVYVLRHKRVHATIIDADSDQGRLSTVRIIRMDYPRLPCLLLSSDPGRDLLDRALQMEIFSVLAKPVDLDLLRRQLNRLFVKTYECPLFTSPSEMGPP